VKGEGHRVAHLTGLWQRCEKLGGGKINPEIALRAAALREPARCVQTRLVRIDQGQHGPKRGIVGASPLGRRGKVEQPPGFRVHHADLGDSLVLIGCKLHARSSLAFFVKLLKR